MIHRQTIGMMDESVLLSAVIAVVECYPQWSMCWCTLEAVLLSVSDFGMVIMWFRASMGIALNMARSTPDVAWVWEAGHSL
jgi:hypothetical protein